MCQSAGVPLDSDRPAANGDGTSSVPDIYLAWTKLWIGESDLMDQKSDTAWQSFGFDLDGVCTNSSTCPAQMNVQSCKPATAQIPFDGALCRDNTFASLQPVAAAVPEIGKRFGLGESVFNCNLWRGSYNMMWKVSGYNGKANDSDVRVDFYVSPGLVKLPPYQCPLDGFDTMYPVWRTSMTWNIDPDNLTAAIGTPGTLPPSKMFDAHAYVRDGYLVARPQDDSLIRLAGDGTAFRGFAMRVSKAIWSGQLYTAQDGTWKMRDGLAAGRIRSGDLIQSFRQIGLCQGVGLDQFNSDVIDYINQNADITIDGANDPERPCDAMSIGIAFEAAQATPGPAQAAVPLVECCAPGTAIEDCNPICGDGRLNGKEKCDTAIAQGQPGACPTTCNNKDACTPTKLTGTGCDTECADMPITDVGAQDGCCPNGADANSDKDCAAMCGNGIIEGKETCDPPGACGTCTSSDQCLMANATGSADSCDLQCTFTPLTTCKNSDGCCPSGCTSSNDSDCSKSCGNGKVDAGEKCETSGANACPSSCDDGNNCTTDYMTGSTKNCNVTCTHVPITKPIAGDKCCPMGASTNTDSDCVSMCGNKQVEGTEECDDGNQVAGDGCTPDCKKESTLDTCLAKIPMASDRPDCAKCNCEKCGSNTIACYGASDPSAAQRCADLVKCGLDKGCSTDACYCGDQSFATCALGLGDGPCRSQVEAASGSTLVGDILIRADDASYPVGRANQLAACARTNCATECGIKQ
jgi:cysteine-rich repeat protein